MIEIQCSLLSRGLSQVLFLNTLIVLKLGHCLTTGTIPILKVERIKNAKTHLFSIFLFSFLVSIFSIFSKIIACILEGLVGTICFNSTSH